MGVEVFVFDEMVLGKTKALTGKARVEVKSEIEVVSCRIVPFVVECQELSSTSYCYYCLLIDNSFVIALFLTTSRYLRTNYCVIHSYQVERRGST